jgi:hypothetical protein
VSPVLRGRGRGFYGRDRIAERVTIRGNSADNYLEVHSMGATGVVLGSIGKSKIETAFAGSVKAIEARSDEPAAGSPARTTKAVS